MVGEKNGSTNLLAGGTVGGGRLLHEGGGLLATGEVAALGAHQDLLTAGLAHDARSATAGLETHPTLNTKFDIQTTSFYAKQRSKTCRESFCWKNLTSSALAPCFFWRVFWATSQMQKKSTMGTRVPKHEPQ